MDKKIVVGVSGGVDSTASLIILKKQGYSPVAVHFVLPKYRSNLKKQNNTYLLEKACRKWEIYLHKIDTAVDFKKTVVDYYINELRQGGTPSPCVVCNYQFKFKKLFEYARTNGIGKVATGHYSRIRETKYKVQKTKKCELLKAKDDNKDQSYYLSFLKQEWLGKIIFPLGELTKKEVYKIAKKEGFDFASRIKQSQDFCYLGTSKIDEYLKKEIGPKPGLIIDDQGKVLGKHQGLHFYTVGQRKGINLSGGPYYVKELDVSRNKLIVTKDKKIIFQKKVILSPFNFIFGEAPKEKIKIAAKVRYRQVLQSAILCPLEASKLKVVFDKPISAATPGQVCVWYKNEVCLGGGVII